MSAITPASLAASLKARIDAERAYLEALSEAAASVRPSQQGWSPKEELGHLIDSAVNNHARFVIGAIGPEMRGPRYAQDDWVSLHGYHEQPWSKLVSWWYAHNEVIVALIARIPADRLTVPCYIDSHPAATLQFIVEDYSIHLQHHIDHLLSRPVITSYPQV